MFEQEIQEIRQKLSLTMQYHRKARKLKREIDKLERFNEDKIFYVGMDLKYRHYIYEQANRALRGLLEDAITYHFTGISISQEGYMKDFKKNVKTLKALTNADILKALKAYLTPDEYRKEIKVHINKNTAEIQLGEYLLDLLLNVLNIMNSGELETKEIRDKAKKVLKECNTFIYRDIKITVYKNGKMKLVFNNQKVFEEFKKFTSDVLSIKEKQAV